MRPRAVLVFSTLLSMGFVCDAAHPPAIRNCFSEIAIIDVIYSDGAEAHVSLQPGAALWAHPGDVQLMRVEVRVGADPVRIIDREELMAAMTPANTYGVALSSAGIKPLTRREYDCE